MVTSVMCDIDISKFPFDTQYCWIELLFWYFNMDEVSMANLFTEAQTFAYLQNGEWHLDSTGVSNRYTAETCCPVTYNEIEYIEFTFSRRRPYYVMNLLLPTILLSVCMVWVFVLPTECGERLSYTLTILLSYTVMLSITSNLMPTTSIQTPYIATYLLTVLVMCSLCVSSIALHVKLYHLQDTPFQWLQAIYRKLYPIVFCTCCTKRHTEADTNLQGTIKLSEFINNNKNKQMRYFMNTANQRAPSTGTGSDVTPEVKWTHISILLDRLCFYVYFIAMLGVNIYLVISLG